MKTKVLLMAVLAFSAGAASAEGSWYFGGSVGQSKIDAENIARDAASLLSDDYGATGVYSSQNETDTSWKLYAGYKLDKNFSIEGGFADFGQLDAKAGGVIVAPVLVKAKVSSYAIFVDAVGTLPLNDQFSIFGKVGGAFAHTKAKVTGSWAGFSDSESESSNDFVPKLGLGAEFNVNKSVAIRGEYEYYFNVGDEDKTGQSDVGIWTLGVKVGF